MSDYIYAETPAARMLRDGLRAAAGERGLSVRQIGKLLGYKQAVVLSHMASGHVPIPIDRALDIAEIVGLPGKKFLVAVLRQRHKDVNWGLITDVGDDFTASLEALVGGPLSQLTGEHRNILRDVVVDRNPSRRWLSLAEVPLVEAIRAEEPHLRTEGIPVRQIEAVVSALRRAK
jgi:hypothetical protein